MIRTYTLFYFMLMVAHSANLLGPKRRVIQEFDNFDAGGWELLSLLNFHVPQEIMETEIYTKFERERLRIEGEKPGLKPLV